jgi:hypothetical protein
VRDAKCLLLRQKWIHKLQQKVSLCHGLSPKNGEIYLEHNLAAYSPHVFGIHGILMLITGEVPRTLAIFSKFLNTKAKSKILAQNSIDKKYNLKQVYCIVILLVLE